MTRLIDADALRDELTRYVFMAGDGTAALMQAETVLATVGAAPTLGFSDLVLICAGCVKLVELKRTKDAENPERAAEVAELERENERLR